MEFILDTADLEAVKQLDELLTNLMELPPILQSSLEVVSNLSR